MRSRPSSGVPVKARYWALGSPARMFSARRSVLGAVGLVDDDDDVVAVRQQRILPCPCRPAEFLDQGEHQRACSGRGTRASPRCPWAGRRSALPDRAGVEEVAVNLAVQILAVGDDHEGEVARSVCGRSCGHRRSSRSSCPSPGCARRRRACRCRSRAAREGVEGVVDADELVVLGDDLLGVLVVEDEVLEVVEQPVLARTGRAITRSTLGAFRAGFARGRSFPSRPPRAASVKKCSQSAVRLPTRVSMALERTQKALVEEELRDVRLVVGQVVVVGGLELDVGVLQFDEDQRQAVDVEQDVGPAAAALAPNPQLGDCQVLVAPGLGRGLSKSIIRTRSVSLRPVSGPSVATYSTVTPSRISPYTSRLAATGSSPGALLEAGDGLFAGAFRQIGVQTRHGGAQAVEQDHLALVGPARAVLQILGLRRMAVPARRNRTGAASVAAWPARSGPRK